MSTKKKYSEGFVESHTTKLQYLDWGGDGKVLVLLCGLGDTPFLFENLAEQLSPNFRIVAYSRRNHAKSASKEDKFDNETLVADLKLLLDSLHINKASLLGWSLGGNEITGFAARYPDRVEKLIYFESGYDLSDGGFEKLVVNIPKNFLPDSFDIQSLNNYREWYHRFWFGDIEWNNSLENNLLASVQIKSDSSVEILPDNNDFKLFLSSGMSYRREYNKVKAPSLVIYTKPFMYPANTEPETIKSYNELESNIVSPWREANKKRIEKELPNATIVEAPSGSHTSFLFLSNDFLTKTITSFLVADKKSCGQHKGIMAQHLPKLNFNL